MRLTYAVAARDATAFVGRERELAVLAGLLRPGAPHRVAFVSGPAGIGKSALLRELRRRAEAAGHGGRLVTVRTPGTAPEELLSDLAADAVLVLELRARPDPAWWTTESASSAVTLSLDPLPPSDATRLLSAHGINDPVELDELVRWADGLPLALVMAAAARAGGGGPLGAEARARLDGDVLDHLTDRLLADPALLTADRLVLAVAALAAAVDAALLASVLPELAPGSEAERWVRGLSFSEPHGLRVALHHGVRRLLAARLRDDDPELERMLRVRIIDHLADVAGQGRPDVVVEMREVLAPPVDRGVAPSMLGASAWRLETGRPEDADAVGRLLGGADREHVAWVQRWLREAPEHAVVVRDAERPEPAAVAVWLTPAGVPDAFRGDPRLADWLRWLATADPSGNALMNPVTEVFVPGPAADEVGRLVLHALAQRCGLPNFRLWLTTHRPGAPDPRHCGGIRTAELDLELGATVVEGWVLDYGREGVIPSLRAQAHADLDRSATSATAAEGLGPAAHDTVREALRCFRDPVALARSPLARGDDPAERAAYVAELLRDAVDHAFGAGPGAEQQREVLLRGYLDHDADHSRAMRALHLSRTTYFRRLREATAQLTAWLETSARPVTGPGPR